MTIYLDNAASSCPKPESVIRAVNDCMIDACANPGRGAHRKAVAAARIIFRTRQQAAQFLGVADSVNIIFTQNATDSLNMALHGFLRPGDHVVTSSVEHNAVLRPLKVLAREGIEVSFAPADAAGRVESDAVLDLVKPQTRLVVLTHSSNITGAVLPIAELARELAAGNVPLLVDGAQSAGTLPLDMEQMPVSMLALTGHKGLLGPQGVGLLYLAPGIELRSLRQGGTGSSSEQEQDELERPDRYECGTFNTPGIAGLGAGIQYLQEQGMERLAAHKAALTARLYEGLAGVGGVTVYGPGAGERRGPLVAFNVASLPSSEVAAKLDHDYDIASRAGIHCAPGAHRAMGTLGRGAVRLSIGPFNTEEDIDAAVAAVTAIAAAV